MSSEDPLKDIVRDPRSWTVEACRAFFDQWDDQAFEDPQAGARLAELGGELVARIEARTGKAQPVLRARLLAIRGTLCRVGGNLAGASQHYEEARRIYAELKEPLDEADLYRRLVYLYRDLQQWEEAFDAALRAGEIFTAAGDLHSYGWVLVAKATLHSVLGKPEAALAELGRALGWLDPVRSPPAFYIAVHNFASALAEIGEPAPELLEQALRWLSRARHTRRPQERRGSKNLGQRKRTVADAKLRYLLGLLLRRTEDAQRAVRFLEEARADLVALAMPLDVVDVSLVLGELYAEKGRKKEVQHLAQETLQLLAPYPHLLDLKERFTQWQTALLAGKKPLELVASCRALIVAEGAPRVLARKPSEKEALRRRLIRTLDAEVSRCHSLAELRERLTAVGIEMHERPPAGARPAGISFVFEGLRFSGHELCLRYRRPRLVARLERKATPRPT